MPVSSKNERKSLPDGANLFGNFPFFSSHNSTLMTRTNEIISQAAKDVWAGELELLRLEAEQASKTLFPVQRDGDAGKQAADYGVQWHDSAEKIITQMRQMGDTMRDCGWQLFELYAQNFKPGPDAKKG